MRGHAHSQSLVPDLLPNADYDRPHLCRVCVCVVCVDGPRWNAYIGSVSCRVFLTYLLHCDVAVALPHYANLYSIGPFARYFDTIDTGIADLTILFTARRGYASAVLGVVMLSVCPSVRPSVCLSHACFVTNPKNLPAIFFYTT